MMKAKKRIVTLALAAAMAVSSIVSAFANSYSAYTITVDGDGEASGPVETMNAERKYYDFDAYGPSGSTVVLSLWQNRWFGDYNWSTDQIFSVPDYSKQAWWFGYQDDIADYHITARTINTSGETVTTVGTFYNMDIS